MALAVHRGVGGPLHRDGGGPRALEGRVRGRVPLAALAAKQAHTQASDHQVGATLSLVSRQFLVQL